MPHDPKAQIKAASKRDPKPRKFRNKKVTEDGIEYDSKKEAKRGAELRLLLAAGKIESLSVHREFTIQVNGFLICKYEADFTYRDKLTGQIVVEDVKSAFTRKLPVYRLKNKLMRAVHGIEIREV